MTATFDPELAIRVLLAHRVRFIIIGGIGGGLWGSPTVTVDLDICHDRSRDNLEPLASALKELHATLRGAPAGLPFQLDARTLSMGDSFTFNTDAGPLDCLGTPSGTTGYEDLMKNASELELDEDLRVLVASLDDIIRMKRAAARKKDLIEVEILEAVKEERSR